MFCQFRPSQDGSAAHWPSRICKPTVTHGIALDAPSSSRHRALDCGFVAYSVGPGIRRLCSIAFAMLSKIHMCLRMLGRLVAFPLLYWRPELPSLRCWRLQPTGSSAGGSTWRNNSQLHQAMLVQPEYVQCTPREDHWSAGPKIVRMIHTSPPGGLE